MLCRRQPRECGCLAQGFGDLAFVAQQLLRCADHGEGPFGGVARLSDPLMQIYKQHN